MPFDMMKLAHNEGIRVEYWDFRSPIEGLYVVSPGHPPIIGISNKLFENGPKFRCVLAEELGHHFTTVGEVLPKKYFHYRDRLYVSQAEYRALKWAAKYLMPGKEVQKVVKRGCRQTWELAEYFNVTKEMVVFRIGLPDQMT